MSSSSKYVISGPSLSFCGLLTIVFITLKLTHVIDWSWWLVLLPLYGPWTAFFLFFLMVSFVLVVMSGRGRKNG